MPAAKLKKQRSLAPCEGGGRGVCAHLCRFSRSLEDKWQSARVLSGDFWRSGGASKPLFLSA